MAIIVHDLLTAIDTTRKQITGTTCEIAGNKYIYLKGVASTVAGSWVQITHDGTDFTTALLTETIGVAGTPIAVAMAATVADTYGWYCICGVVEAAGLIDDVANAEQFCTTTAGSLDDAGTTAVQGIRLLDTLAAAGNGTFVIFYPHAGN